MPIYAYRCADCGHTKDVLQKLSDPVLTTCPACHAEAFSKQLTAAGFQLKGSGWYVTDFRGNGGGKSGGEAKSADAGGNAATGGEAKGDAPAAAAAASTPDAGSSSSGGACGGSCACH
jgi:putative FmdB family regulatory protein